MKKIIRIGILGVIALLLFTSCDLSAFIENEEGHKHTYSEEFTSDKTGHWHQSTCEHNLRKDFSSHSYGDFIKESEEYGYYLCEVCGYKKEVINEKPHEHTYDDYYTYDVNFHWKAANCGHDLKISQQAHKFGDFIKESDEFGYYICEVCGFKKDVVSGSTHEHTYNEIYNYNSNYHWKDANCGHDAQIDYNPHSYGEFVEETEFVGYYLCEECGYKKEVITEHEHTFDDFYSFDEEYHWMNSTCGCKKIKKDYETHNYGELITTSDVSGYYLCKDCNYKKEVVIEHEHTYVNVWGYDDYYHWKETTCGHTDANIYEPHSLICLSETDDKRVYECIECGYVFEEFKSVLTMEYSIGSKGQYVLTFSASNRHWLEINRINNIDTVVIKGNQVADYLISEIYIGSNIYKVDFFGEYNNLKKITFSSDVEELGDMIIYNCSESIEEIVFEGTAPKLGKGSLTLNGGKTVSVTIIGDYEELLFGGHPVVGNIPSDTTIPDLSIAEYGLATAIKATDLAKQLVELANIKDMEAFLYYPLETNIQHYKEIKEFTLELTKDCVTEEECIGTIYEYIVSNVVYSTEALSYSAYDVLMNNKAVCAGYVTLMHDMLASVGIISFYTRGATLGALDGYLVENIITKYDETNMTRENHAWLTVVKEDGSVSFYDPTWGGSLGDAYYDMDVNEIGNHVVTYELDFIEVIIDEINYTLFTQGIIQYLEGEYIYQVIDGRIMSSSSSEVYNDIIPVNFTVSISNDGYKSYGEKQLEGTVYNNGLIIYGGDFIPNMSKFANFDGRSFSASSVFEFIDIEKEYGNNIELVYDDIIIYDNCMYLVLSNGTLSLFAYLGDEENIVIPAYVNGMKVTWIGYNAFIDNNKIVNVTISEGIENISECAFMRCNNLETVNVPKSVVYFGGEVERQLFTNCPSLKEVNIDPNNQNFVSVDGNVYTKDMKTLLAYAALSNTAEFVVPEGVETIANYAFSSAKVGLIVLSESLKSINHHAFEYSCIEEIHIPANCEIADSAFYYSTYLRKVVIADGIEKIGDYAFANCQSLVEISLPSTLKRINQCMFLNCMSLYTLEIPNNVSHIDYMAFFESGLVSVVLPSSLMYIDSNSFECCYKLFEIYNHSNLNLVAGSSNYGFVAKNAINIFKNNEESQIVIKDEFLFYGDVLLSYVGFGATELILPSDINGQEYSLCEHTFWGESEIGWIGDNVWFINLCHPTINVNKVVLPEFITEIPEYAFAGCVNIKEITISNKLKKIGNHALGGVNLNKINFIGTEEEFRYSPLAYLYDIVEINYIS